MHFYNAALASEVEGTAQKHFWTAQPPFFEGIIEHEVPVMDPEGPLAPICEERVEGPNLAFVF